MQKLRILILYPDSAGLALLTSMLKSLGHTIEEAQNDRVAVRLMERNNIDLVLAGVDPLESDSLEILSYVRRKHRDTPVILLFPRQNPERAKEALRMGAMAVLKYPVPAAELRATVLQALEQSSGSARPMSDPALAVVVRPISGVSVAESATPAAASGDGSAGAAVAEGLGTVPGAPAPGVPAPRLDQAARELGLLGQDPGWRQVLDLASTIASTRSSVLIVGETGTGKSLVARLIHTLGKPRCPFATVSCLSLADQMPVQRQGEELLQEDAQAATAEWRTKLSSAQGGTLYLDEVAALPLELQLNLLRELQFRDYEAAAGRPSNAGEVRFLMSTRENLPALIDQGRFRQELYHRVSVISLMLPPLRHRGGDIELLAEHFRNRYAQEFHKNVLGFTRDALDVLARHDWPGNVRELEAAVQRAVALCAGPRIASNHLAPIINHSRQARAGTAAPKPHLKMGVRPLKEALEEPEKKIIIQALQAFNWNRQETARVLDINRTTLYKKMKKYGLLIDEPIWVS